MSVFVSQIYFGTVIHRRFKPRAHRLSYRVFSLYLDLDELPELNRRLAFLAYNRAGLFSFRDRDHGPGTDTPLRPWVEGHLANAGITLAGGAIRLLCYPRILGYVFNPLSVYFCHRADGVLVAILYEVSNTFGERHTYLIPVDGPAGGTIHQRCSKQFYVSPFNSVVGTYGFRIVPPGDRVAVVIDHEDDEGPLLTASFTGRAAPLSDRTLAMALIRYPLMTLKVIAGIHWEAFRLWRKGLSLVRRPPPPDRPVTAVGPTVLPFDNLR